jgi:hypothetical protein
LAAHLAPHLAVLLDAHLCIALDPHFAPHFMPHLSAAARRHLDRCASASWSQWACAGTATRAELSIERARSFFVLLTKALAFSCSTFGQSSKHRFSTAGNFVG